MNCFTLFHLLTHSFTQHAPFIRSSQNERSLDIDLLWRFFQLFFSSSLRKKVETNDEKVIHSSSTKLFVLSLLPFLSFQRLFHFSSLLQSSSETTANSYFLKLLYQYKGCFLSARVWFLLGICGLALLVFQPPRKASFHHLKSFSSIHSCFSSFEAPVKRPEEEKEDFIPLLDIFFTIFLLLFTCRVSSGQLFLLLGLCTLKCNRFRGTVDWSLCPWIAESTVVNRW